MLHVSAGARARGRSISILSDHMCLKSVKVLPCSCEVQDGLPSSNPRMSIEARATNVLSYRISNCLCVQLLVHV
jgi:hypothetical protein